MFKKNSIFIKVFVPVIVVMLLQTGIIGIILFANGTLESLDSSALETLSKNAENRGMNLERQMIYYWSNLDGLEADITEEIDGYLETNAVSFAEARGNKYHETEMLYNISGAMLNALRRSAATGVFIYFLDGGGYREDIQTCRGLYYRNLDPVVHTADNSDIMFLRGHIDIARKDKIQLDSLWAENFSFNPEYEDVWRGFSYPQIAAAKFPEASAVNLAYWNKPHFVNPWSPLDANKCITYNSPLFYNGELIAIIGTEMQVSQLERHFLPAGDFDNYGEFGYMLIQYNTDSEPEEPLPCGIFQVTGSYAKRLIGSRKSITLNPTRRNGVYSAGDDTEPAKIVHQPLRLYNNNAPFAAEQWSLAAIGTDNKLFESSRKVSRGILYSSLFAFILGGAILVLTVRRSTKPIILIAHQIEDSGQDIPVIKADTDTYEIVLLSRTINAMNERRKLAEAQIREERQRYLVALESAADTFLEYDIPGDIFMLYYFSEGSGEKLSSKTIYNFMREVLNGGFCHPDDVKSVIGFINPAVDSEPVEIRARTSVFPHITVVPDGDYYWFLLKASPIYGGGGAAAKIIGTAREITREKFEEYAGIEAARRDITTGLYNFAYGSRMIRRYGAEAAEQGAAYALSILRINNFEDLEALYGRVFGAIYLKEFSLELASVLTENDFAVRMNYDKFLIFFSGADKNNITRKTEQTDKIIKDLYSGEKSDLKLGVRIGTVIAADETDEAELIQDAYNALRYADKTEKINEFYDETPQSGAYNIKNRPVSIFLDIAKDNITAIAFELFERTTDGHSAIKILIGLLGRLFSLSRVIICSFDASFGANQVSYQWHKKGLPPHHLSIEKVSHRDLSDFEALLDENGTMLYNNAEKSGTLLCLTQEHISAYCCVMYENAVHVGRMLFISEDTDKIWSDDEKYILYETVKIIATHINIEKSRSASRAKSEFLSRISHEIRTPMNAIIGMTDIAINSQGNPERMEECLEKIDFSAKHLLSLINDVLEMSRIESGKLTIENEPFSLDNLVSGVEELMRLAIENKQIIFNAAGRFKHAEVIGDEYRLRQVIVNLLGNAGKFTKPGGSVTFSAEELEETDGGYADFKFSVKDTGIGIAPEDQPLIFKAFEQGASSPSSGRHQGTGLGLAISGSIISSMGGKIELNSSPGEGSEFYFIIKLKLSDSRNQDSGGSGEKNIDYTGYFTGRRVLLVDDIDINLEIASFFLEKAGLIVETAMNGQEAADKFFGEPPGYYDAILMDIQMPVMDGLAATRKIRGNADRPDARSVPIIAMTANAFDEDMKKSVESGMNGHVTKPIESEKLFVLLKQFIIK